MSTSEKQALLDSARATQRYQPQPRPPPVRPTRALNLSISVLILVFFALWSQNPFRSTDAVYHAGGKALPHTYAICSREGKRVYTVPVEGGVGAVECVVAKGKEVLDTGSLGQSYCSSTIVSDRVQLVSDGSTATATLGYPPLTRAISNQRARVLKCSTCLQDTP